MPKLIAFSLVLASGMCAMEHKEIAPGVSMPVVSIGTWTDARTHKVDPKTIVRNWLELGYRGIDTAWNYFNQRDIAEVIAESGVPREDLFITSKVFVCEPISARAMIEYDLKALNTNYIDLMLIHTNIAGFDGCVETWKVLEGFHKRGKLRAIGVSNWGLGNLKRVMKHATVPIAVHQVEYNVFRHNEKVIEYCDAHNITMEAWSPLGGTDSSITGRSVFKDKTVLSIAAAHNVSAAQVALKFIAQRGHLIAVMSTNQKHQANDADLFGFTLSADEMDRLKKIQWPIEHDSDAIEHDSDVGSSYWKRLLESHDSDVGSVLV